ncbi:class C beta-lactamase [Pararhizobium sp.]|uniref:class C beta-lactamase n=1 Tax=Pararhizobium sp. TaxID=1977563 RepID=UPI003D0F3B63
MKTTKTAASMATLVALFASTAVLHAADDEAKVKAAVDVVIRPIMEKHNIPGMAIGITVGGKPYLFDYGVASKETRQPVSVSTIFEVGSISKTFTATLASYAEMTGQLSLSDKTSTYLPSLQGTAFGDVSLFHLGTHTPGGFPLQLPDDIKTNDQLMRYFAAWKPTYKAGTYRTYANPSIGMLGVITAKSMNGDYAALMEGQLFQALGLTSSYINVPKTKMQDYAQGYTRKDAPARVTAAVLSSEAYGVRTTASDLLRFVQANMKMIPLDEKLQRAITATHKGYFIAGKMTQDLIWEQYAYPVDLNTLLQGNSNEVIYKPTPVTQLTPPQEPREDVLINKTGSTNGFGAYVAFVPEKQLGIVILANKNYPNEDRITAAHQILTQLGVKNTSED